jgi:Phytanoyl-CoA dioxygenase (PhyH)
LDQQFTDEQARFDEASYLRLNPDVAKALATGQIRSGWEHYNEHGRREGRKISDFDADFYLRAYPIAAEEIAAGRAADPLTHYQTLGRTRGFLPNLRAERPTNAAALPSSYGGLWPDAASAEDIIAGRLEVGQITAAQAEKLQFWIHNGYVILEQAIPVDVVDAAARDLERAYAGGFPKLRFECHGVSVEHMTWRPEINPHPAKALDIHHYSPAIRELMFADAIADFLALIFEAKAFASQSLGFLRGSAQEGHQDSAYVPFTIPRQFAASWTALEDVTLGAGELFYYPGSHRWPDFIYADRFKSVSEVQRMNGDRDMRAEIVRHVESLEQRAKQAGIAKMPFAARKGDVLIWHADLVHGGNPVSQSVTRKSIVTHYCPKHLAPLFGENMQTRLWHHRGHSYTTSHYSDEPAAAAAS